MLLHQYTLECILRDRQHAERTLGARDGTVRKKQRHRTRPTARALQPDERKSKRPVNRKDSRHDTRRKGCRRDARGAHAKGRRVHRHLGSQVRPRITPRAYQEQSTRALPFTMENLGMPYEVKGTEYETKMLTLSQKEIDLYQKIYDKLLVHLNEKFAHLRVKADEDVEAKSGVTGAKLSEREWEGIIKAKAFDVARYLLPQNMTTSLGVTLNTRRFMDQLSEWQSSELMEMRVLG
ncbi:FAD-dependent thymidylate synthase, partial [Candidatus Woesearchaeota archaeon]|nr:FAD-dependent thymidylate synthase [Candidatus Woesearchaeota archaeon]